MKLFSKKQIAVTGALVALAFSAGLAQSALAGPTDTPLGAQRSAVLGGGELRTLELAGPLVKGRYLEAAAAYIGISVEALRSELAAGKSLAEIAVANGKTRAGLIDALAAQAREDLTTLVDRKGTDRPDKPRPGHVVKVAVEVFKVAMDYLGIDRAALMERVRNGETLAEIANATSGKNRDGLVAAVVAAANAQVDQAVANGRITAERAAELKADQETMAERLVDSEMPLRGKGFPGRGPKPDRERD